MTATAPPGARRRAGRPAYRLVPSTPPVVTAPALDPDQQRVVAHAGGPLLVLAGPGTGKTTTLVESVVRRIEDGLDPSQALVLTFSRRAAADLRRRITGRLGRSTVTPPAMTFHALCYQLLRRFGRSEPGSTLRLLTAPEQDLRVREVLAGSTVRWPAGLEAAVPTHTFAAELRAAMARARQLGLDPEDLVEAGEATNRPAWTAMGAFFAEYLDITDAEQVLDYAELVHRCRILLATDQQVTATLRREIACVYVDEYQDTDAAQIDLLRLLVPSGGDLVVVGDPDQSIYAFRGADPRNILDFPDRFRTRDGEPAPVAALTRTRRFGPVLAAAARRVSGRLPLPRTLPAGVARGFRDLDCAETAVRGRVEVLTCASPGAEAEHIAELLRSAHLHDGVAWADMAVLVRSGRRSIPGLARSLVAGGVPIEVAGDEIPLSAELAVRPLLLALQVAADGRRPDGDEASRLLTSPLGGLDSLGLRRLGRVLRDAERARLGGSALPRLSHELVVEALSDPALLDDTALGSEGSGGEVRAARRLAELLARVGRLIADGAGAATALWELWSATDWPERLRAEAAAGGDAGRRADRDLDAVCALFGVADQSEEKAGYKGVTAFLADVAGQQIPADTWRESELRGSGVRLLTAHRAKGLEWPLVVVASVQEGVWPDLRRRSTLLETDDLPTRAAAGDAVVHPIGDDGPAASSDNTAGRQIAEERRLFYVACTRATRRLVVTAVEGTDGENDQPSRFVAELGVTARALPGRPRRPLSLPGLVGELRATAVDPQAPAALRDAAAARLARLADARDEAGRVLVPSADPARWWGMFDPTRAEAPVVAPEAHVRLSGSQLAGVLECPRKWFLTRRARGEPVRQTAASFGSVVHVLVEHAARRRLDTDPDAPPMRSGELRGHLDEVWDQLDFDAPWLSDTERIEAESALERYLLWDADRLDRELLAVEKSFDTVVDCGTEQVHLTGTIDRIERDRDGRIHVIDFKTGRRAPKAADLPSMEQLGVYQLAVQQGALADVVGPAPILGGAELVYLRLPDGSDSPYPKVLVQPSLDDAPHLPEEEASGAAGWQAPTWVHARLAEAAATIRGEQFEARLGPACSYCPFRDSCPAHASGRQVVQ